MKLFHVLVAAATLLSLSHCSLAPRQACSLTCADPDYSADGQCCEGSQCMLRGCVRSGFLLSWRPNNCTQCYCDGEGREMCTVNNCSTVPKCYGYPMIRKPGRCCQECDFNVSDTECGAVPRSTRSIEVSTGETSCQQSVVEYVCDKTYLFDGVWSICDAVREEVVQAVTDLPPGVPASSCGPQISQVTYERVTRCQKRQLEPLEIPQDLDLNTYDCSWYIGEEGGGDGTTPSDATPTNDGVVGSAPPTNDGVVGSAPPTNDGVVGSAPPTNDGVVGGAPPTNDGVVGGALPTAMPTLLTCLVIPLHWFSL